MAKKKYDKSDKEDDENGKQHPPPTSGSSSHEHKHKKDDEEEDDDDHKHKHHVHWKYWDHHSAHAIYDQLVLTRKTLDQLVDDAKEAKLAKQLDHLPVNLSDLMRGFQAAVSRANRAVISGEDGGEDIEQMVIKNLEVSVDAPLINEAHAEDPMIMLPNENSKDHSQAKVALKFSVVSVPKTQT